MRAVRPTGWHYLRCGWHPAQHRTPRVWDLWWGSPPWLWGWTRRVRRAADEP